MSRLTLDPASVGFTGEDGTWWVSCPSWTAAVKTSGGQIIASAPIVRKFKGQPMLNLLKWCKWNNREVKCELL